MIEVSKNGTELKISDTKSFTVLDLPAETQLIRTLFITGSEIDSFRFLDEMQNLDKLVFLACKSNYWTDLKGTPNIKILRLHNLRQGRDYINNIDFINTFPKLEYLYLNMVGIEKFPDVSRLLHLHTIISICRKLTDYSTLEFAPALHTFVGSPAIDKQKTPAEAFIPILKNPSLKAFDYPQFLFKREDKKLAEYVKTYCPEVHFPMYKTEGYVLDNSEVMNIIKLFF